MERGKWYYKTVRILAAGLWLAGWALCASAGEAAQPSRPQYPGAGAGENAADRIWNKAHAGAPSGKTPDYAPQHGPAAANRPQEHTAQSGRPVPAPAAIGYTEAEIRELIYKKYALARPAFRRASGGAAGADYRPGTTDVKIPVLFFPPDEMRGVSESFRVNPDGSLGSRPPGDMGAGFSGYGAEAQRQLREEQMRQVQNRYKPVPKTGGKYNAPAYGGKIKTGTGYRTVTVQVPVPAPSPFRVPVPGDFHWFTSGKGHYTAVLPQSMPHDPLQKLPAFGPMLIRNASQNEFMAVTVDDPSDTYYFKNKDTFPSYGKAAPVFTETRKTIQGNDVNIKYIRRYLGSEYCLIVDSAGKRGGKTYRTAIVFPESKQYEYLPKALFMIENLKGF